MPNLKAVATEINKSLEKIPLQEILNVQATPFGPKLLKMILHSEVLGELGQ